MHACSSSVSPGVRPQPWPSLFDIHSLSHTHANKQNTHALSHTPSPCLEMGKGKLRQRLCVCASLARPRLGFASRFSFLVLHPFSGPSSLIGRVERANTRPRGHISKRPRKARPSMAASPQPAYCCNVNRLFVAHPVFVGHPGRDRRQETLVPKAQAS